MNDYIPPKAWTWNKTNGGPLRDDWRGCKITRPEDVRDLFMPNFFFGCEGDDRSAAAAFDRKMNPYGASLNPMFGSDIGHFDVEACGSSWRRRMNWSTTAS